MKKQIALRLDEDKLKQFRMKLLEDGKNTQNILESAINNYLEEKESDKKIKISLYEKIKELDEREKKIRQKEDELLQIQDRMYRDEGGIALRAELRNRLIKINKSIDSELSHFEILEDGINQNLVSELKTTIILTIKKMEYAIEVLKKTLKIKDIIEIK